MASNSEYASSPTAWFAALERAIRTGDLQLAEQCERELKRLGIDVSILPSAAIGLSRPATR